MIDINASTTSFDLVTGFQLVTWVKPRFRLQSIRIRVRTFRYSLNSVIYLGFYSQFNTDSFMISHFFYLFLLNKLFLPFLYYNFCLLLIINMTLLKMILLNLKFIQRYINKIHTIINHKQSMYKLQYHKINKNRPPILISTILLLLTYRFLLQQSIHTTYNNNKIIKIIIIEKY